MKHIWNALIAIPIVVNAQTTGIEQQKSDSEGIRFESGLNWQQIVTKAKEERKFIFVDCSATWCGPCKRMDTEVFSQKEVGDFMNAHFISVQVQIDTSKNDRDDIRRWYAEAHRIQEQYKVKQVPTYLFFSPEGEIVHRESDAMSDSLFIRSARNALDPDRQYYSLLAGYLKGRKDYTKMRYLGLSAKRLGDDSLGNVIAADYLHNCLDNLSEKELCQKKHLDFVSFFASILSSGDRVFDLLYKKGDTVDKIVERKDFSKGFVSYVITKEEISPILWPNKKAITTKPDWNGLWNRIRRKYNEYYTSLVILNSQTVWYSQKKDWPQLIKYTVAKIEKFGLDTAGIGWAVINNIAYDIFLKYCNNKDTLTRMIHWMETINKDHPNDYINMDTYANLLYKAGRKAEAIYWEEKASKLETEAARAEGKEPSSNYRKVLEKMSAGSPTWVN